MLKHRAQVLTKKEKGAVVPLVALLLTVFVIFAAIVIDSNLLASSREQTQHFARLAALAAINGHFSSGQTTLTGQVNDALAAAQSVSDKNIILSDQSGPTSQASMHLPSGSGGAELIPGVWFLADDDASDPVDPCPTGYPCFQPSDLTDPDAKVTAYQVIGSLYQGITTAISRRIPYLGSDVFPANVVAIASVIPRHGCFIIDLSGSMVRDTHPARTTTLQDTFPFRAQNDPLYPEGGRGREFAFLLESENGGVEDYYHTQNFNYLCSAQLNDGSPPPNACVAGQPRPAVIDDAAGIAAWNAWLTLPQYAPFGRTYQTNPATDLTPLEISRLHFHTDYVKKKTLGDQHWAQRTDWSGQPNPLHPDPSSDPRYQVDINSTDGKWFRIDADPSGQAGGPEPLKTVFAGLNAAMRTFNQRRVAGDRACLIFYDVGLSWPRVVNLTDNFDYLERLTDFTGGPAITLDSDGILDTALTDANQSGLELIIRHMLFPSGPAASTTNTTLALTEAMNQLTSGNPEGGFSSDFVVAIGDGMGNCDECIGLDGNAIPGCTPGCENQYSKFDNAQSNLLNFVTQEIVGNNRNIPIHQIVVGRAVAPHTLDVTLDPSGSGDCISDIDFRRNAAGQPFVHGGFPATFTDFDDAYNNASPSNPFWEANVTPYEIAAGTRGLWGPIRPQPPGTDKDNCPTRVCTGSLNDLANAPRITEDPLCRTTDQQIQDYMGQIIGDNPYTLVFVGENG